MGKCLPFSLENRKSGWMERITCLESLLKKFSGFSLGCRSIHGCPLGGKLSPPFEAPIGECFGHVFLQTLITPVFKKSAANYLTDLRLIVRNQVLGHTVDLFDDNILPAKTPVTHFRFALRKADNRCAPGRPRKRSY